MKAKIRKRYKVKHPRFYVGVGLAALFVGISMNFWTSILPQHVIFFDSLMLIMLGAGLVAKYHSK